MTVLRRFVAINELDKRLFYGLGPLSKKRIGGMYH